MSLKGVSSNSSLHFQLAFRSLEGYANLLARKVEKQTAVHLATYKFRGCIFNTTSRRFEGRFHDTIPCRLVESLQTGAVICPIEQIAFFYCTQLDPTLILVTELIALFHSGSSEHQICLGWSMLPLFDHRGNVSRVGKSPSLDTVRLALYEGSPRALFSLSHPTASTKELTPIPGCILTCSLSPHPTLAKAAHLLPPNTLLSMEEAVPGLIPTKVMEAFPKLVKTSSGNFEKVSLLLLPSVDDFEEHLLSSLSEDLASGGGDMITTGAVSIEERRLKVMLYNGWCYTGSPVIGYLERGSLATGKLSGSMRGSTFGLRGSLVLKGSLEVSDLVFNANTEVVLQLEYVISWSRAAIFQTSAHDSLSRKASLKGTDKPSTTHSTTLTLAWAVWHPFEANSALSEGEQTTPVSLELKRGFGYKPTTIPSSAHRACYQSNLPDAGKVTFKFTSSKPPSRIDGSQLFNTASVVQFEDSRSPRRTMSSGGRDVPDSGVTFSPLGDEAIQFPPMVSSPLRKTHPSPKRRSKAVEKEEEEEVIFEPLHSIEVIGGTGREVTPSPHHSRVSSISRSVLAYFHNAGLEEFRDKKGNSLPTVDSSGVHSVTDLEYGDVLANGPLQIAVQLLGCSLSDNQPTQRSLSLTLHCSLFSLTTFHCSTTPPSTGSPAHLPHLLTPLDEDGKQPGLMQCYHANHFTLPTKSDRTEFSSFLSTGHLVIDMYDRDSLFLLGTAHVPLRALWSSNGNHSPSYCQSHLSVPLFFTSHTTDTAVTTLTPSHTTPTFVTSPTSSRTGTLFVRVARLPAEADRIPEVKSVGTEPKRVCNVARQLYGSHSHLGAGQHRNNEDEQTRRRKMARMQRVRETKAKQVGDTVFSVRPTDPLSAIESNVVDTRREELKRERIATVLEEFITTTYLLRPRMGRAVYFEHPFTNTHTHPLTISLSWRDPELKLVTDRQEMRCLRQHFSIYTAMDDSLITEGPDSDVYEFFVHPGETVHVPFKYQTFRSFLQTSSSVHSGVEGETNKEHRRKKIIKVYLQTGQQEVTAILSVKVDPLPTRLDQVLHFYHPERTFLKKQLHLPSSRGDTEESDQVFVCCSEPEAVCEVKHSSDSHRSVFIKAPVEASPSVDTLYIMIYYDQQFLISPSRVWKLCVHSAHRVDHNMQIGQSSTVKLMLRGLHSDLRVSCYSFNPPTVKVLTPTPFLLSTQSLTEFPVTLRTLSPGKSSLLVSAVDVDGKTAIQQWMVYSESHTPTISRGFQISLPTGGGALMKKTISFTNPYPKKKSFQLSTNRPDVVEFDSVRLKLQAQETSVLHLNFVPRQSPVTIDVFIFINDSRDLTEECFLVKTVYS